MSPADALESDLLEIMDACIDGRLDEVKLSIRPESALGVVIAAEGYPGSYPKGMEIKGIDAVDACRTPRCFRRARSAKVPAPCPAEAACCA